MAYTTADKLSKIRNSKTNIKNAIILAGVTVPDDTPLSGYADLIASIGAVTDTTTLADLMTICDLYKGVIDRHLRRTYLYRR